LLLCLVISRLGFRWHDAKVELNNNLRKYDRFDSVIPRLKGFNFGSTPKCVVDRKKIKSTRKSDIL